MTSSHTLTDKSLSLEARESGLFAEARAPFAEPGAGPRYAADRSVTIEQLTLVATVDPRSQRYEATATLRLAAIGAAFPPVVRLDFGEASLLSLTVDGAPARFLHADDSLRLFELVGRSAVLTVTYRTSPRRGLYFTGPTAAEPARRPMAWTQCQDEDGHFLFPCIDQPGIKQPVCVEVHAPSGFTVVGNGRLVARGPAAEPGFEAWRWEETQPIPVYLLTFVVAELEVMEEAAGTVPLRYLTPLGSDPAAVRRGFHKTPQMVALFEERYGPYPWPRYDQVVVHDFIFGGMENAGATTLIDTVLTDERAALDWDSDDLIAHELAHQWFGDLVTCQDWSQGWLNEGWATYSEFVWNEVDRGADEAAYALFGHLGSYLDEDSGSYRRPIISYRFRSPIDVFDRHLYEKGALVLHTLRTLLGDGDFFGAARAYLARHAFGAVHTRHLQRAYEDHTGRTLDGFFQSMVESPGHPTWTVTLAAEAGLLSVTVDQTQSGEGVPEAYDLPLGLRLTTAAGARQITLPVRERRRTFALPIEGELLGVEVDPGFRLLCELTLKGPRSLLLRSLAEDGVVGRIRAARALAAEGSPAAIQALIQALRADAFWGVRVEIAALLGENGKAAARAALINALAEPHPKARRAVVSALGGCRTPEVEAALIAFVEAGDPSLHVSGEAAKALGRLRVSGAVERLRALANQTSWAEVLSVHALQGLGFTQDPAALPVLLGWIGEDKGVRARAAAAGALGRLADEVESTRRAAVDALMGLAAEGPFRVRLSAINALGVAKDRRACALLDRIHEAREDGRLARRAFDANRKISAGKGPADAVRALQTEVDKLKEAAKASADRLDRLERAP